jgi:hypothetical protein
LGTVGKVFEKWNTIAPDSFKVSSNMIISIIIHKAVSDYIQIFQSFRIRNPEPLYLLGKESVPQETQNQKASAQNIMLLLRRLKKKMKTGDAEGAYRNYNVDRVFRIQSPSAIRRKTRSMGADELRKIPETQKIRTRTILLWNRNH